ncbi:MAG: alpha/beta hydrolase [Myxococcota bacterium]
MNRRTSFSLAFLVCVSLAVGCATTRQSSGGGESASGAADETPSSDSDADGVPDMEDADPTVGSGGGEEGGLGQEGGTGGEGFGSGSGRGKSPFAGRKTRGGGPAQQQPTTTGTEPSEGKKRPLSIGTDAFERLPTEPKPRPEPTQSPVVTASPDGDATAEPPAQLEAPPQPVGDAVGSDKADGNAFFDAPAEQPDRKRVYPRSSKPVSVPVFFGTDRAPMASADALGDAKRTLGWSVVVGLGLAGLLAYRARRRGTRRAWVLAGAAGLVAVVVIVNAAFPVLRGQLRTDIVYGGERGELVTGIVDVTIPPGHVIGQIEAPSLVTLEITDDPELHIVLQSIVEMPQDDFYAALRERVAKSEDPSAFIFIHGYSTTFEEAAQRTAQIAYDLDFSGAPMMFSWPSQGNKLGYSIDEANAEWAVGHMKQFLERVAAEVGPGTVHLLAHSMGNRVLTKALQLMPATPGAPPRFNEVMLAAPDIDASTFKDQIAPAILGAGKRVTLYASANDEALSLSKKVHGYPRAGDAGEGLVVVAGVDTVDASRVETSLTGHSYFGDNRTVLDDIFRLVRLGMPVDRRPALQARDLKGARYWEFVPPTTAAHAD